MWKYVSRRIRDTFERSVNHFEKRGTTGVVNTQNINEEKTSRNGAAPCCWFRSKKCWNSYENDNGTNSKQWNFEHLNRSWIGAITWSSALVLSWYASQLIHLKHKYHHRDELKGCPSIKSLLSSVNPYVAFVNKNAVCTNSVSQIEKIVRNFAPTVHLMSNEQSGENESLSSTPDSHEDDLGDVLNSIENRLGLAAIENGQHQVGLNLLRSAANRNHPPALYNLGLCYEMGLGVAADEKSAMELYRSAAALEHPGALYNLGIYYGQGRGGLTRDTETAVRLLRLAAVQGQEDAIGALKALDVNLVEPPRKNDDTWTFNYVPFAQTETIVPSHSTLFVENVNMSHAVY